MPPQKIEAAHFSPDTREFLTLLHQHAVRYVIVGGEAVIFHGYAIHLLSLPSLLRACFKIRRGPVFAEKAFWRGETSEHIRRGCER